MILLIDTSQETGTVALTREGKILFSEENKIAKEHAAWLHVAIGRMLEQAKITVRNLEAVAVVAGPGSYTGLRVGMAAAKGFCYALKIPLITQNTLRVMAESMNAIAKEKEAWICPMIDARREEVFTALYSLDTAIGHRSSVIGHHSPVIGHRSSVIDEPPINDGHRSSVIGLAELLPPQAMILDKTAFETELSRNPIVFFGSGAYKWEKISASPHSIFLPQIPIIQSFAILAHRDYTSKSWADPFYSEPVYLKEFFSY